MNNEDYPMQPAEVRRPCGYCQWGREGRKDGSFEIERRGPGHLIA
jgi:hypothetical protein